MKKDELTKLATLYGAHECITHWAVSYRFLGKGDFFARLMQGGDCKTATYQRVLKIFSDQWPSDLAWPSDIPRPNPGQFPDRPVKEQAA